MEFRSYVEIVGGIFAIIGVWVTFSQVAAGAVASLTQRRVVLRWL